MLKNFLFTTGIFFSALFFIQPSFSQAKLRTVVIDAGHGGSDPGAVGQYEGTLGMKEKDITLAIALKLVDVLKREMPDVKVVPTRTTDIYQSPKEKARIANDAKGDLFVCIHADAVAMKTGKRKVGTKTVTRYKTTYKGKGKARKKIRTPYKSVEPVYHYYKIPTQRNGTSVWIFAAHKTSDKLKAIVSEEGDYDMSGHDDTTELRVDYNSPEGRAIAQIYAKRYQEKSDLIATLVNEEVEKTGRPALGVNQRQVGIWVLQATNMPAILVETGFISNPDDERYLASEKGQQEMAEVIARAIMRYRAQLETPRTAQLN